MVFSALLAAAGVVELIADPLHLGTGVVDVLDKRASVIGMLLGAAGLVVSVWGLRPGEPSTAPTAGPGQDSPGAGGAVSGGTAVGQVADGQATGAPGAGPDVRGPGRPVADPG
ncbi:hypothetical protein [Microbispora sp. H13382]|uniref:hypothetical protein n=1 Tax=Microbispora sp. H13382 TaxID=2729112 RepID=UPI001604807C|nr:hypothetical protein [Microbispora sp. H13382]